jgi:hypothetical protein
MEKLRVRGSGSRPERLTDFWDCGRPELQQVYEQAL